MRKLSSWLVTPLAVLALASCAGEPAGGDAAPSSYTSVTDQQGSIDGFVGAAEDATVVHCAGDGDGWSSSGSVENPTDEPQSYRLYVAFNQNRDTIGLVQVDLQTVPAGESAEWTVEAPITGDDLTCVLRVERFTPTK